MKRDFKRLFSLTLIVAVLAAVFAYGAVGVAAEGEPFSVGGVGYASWGAAWNAALNGSVKTIKLEADCDWSGKEVEVYSNVNLDLNGYTMTVGTFVTSSGSSLMDSTNGAGKAICTDAGLALQPDNSHLPVWVGDGYVLVQPTMDANYQKFVAQDDGTYYFAFRPGFGKINGGESFADTYLSGNAAHGLQMEFTVLLGQDYVADDAELDSKTYYFDAASLTEVYTNNKMFFTRLINADSISHLRVKTAIYSPATGVCYSGETMTGKAVLVDFNRNTVTGTLPVSPVTSGRGIMDRFEVIVTDNAYIPEGMPATLRYTGANTCTSVDSGADILEADTVYYCVGISNMEFTSANRYCYYSLRCYFDGNKEDMLQIRGDGNISVCGTNVMKWNSADTVELVFALDPDTGDYQLYNASIDETVSGSIGIALSSGEVQSYNNDATCDVTGLKVYGDVNSDFDTLVASLKQQIKIDKTVTWTWDDGDDNDEIRPENITIGLYVGEELKQSQTVAADALAYTFEKVEIADYVVKVTAVDGYEVSVDGYTITLTHTPTISWVFNSEFDVAPTITIGTNYDTIADELSHSVSSATGRATYVVEDENGFLRISFNEANGRAFFFSNYSSSNQVVDIRFKVRLNSGTLPGGTTRANSLVLRLTNSASSANNTPFYFIGENLCITDGTHYNLTNGWIDVYVQLDGISGAGKYQIGEASGTFTHNSISRLEMFAGGSGTFELDFDDIKICNGTAKTGVSGSVAFDDSDDVDGIRPENVTVNLLQNGTQIDSCVVSEENGWAYTFADLLKYDENDAAYTYTVEAAPVDGYEATVSDGVITLTHVPTSMDVAVTWTWDDSNDNDKIRPENITIGLYVGEELKQSQTVAADALAYTFEKVEIANYEVRVNAVEGYEITVDGYAVTLTHAATIIWLYDNDFSTPADGTAGTLADSGERTLNVTAGYYSVANGYATFNGNEASGSRLFQRGMDITAYPVVDIRFKARLENETVSFPGGNNNVYPVVMRLNNKNNKDRLFYFLEQNVYVGTSHVAMSAEQWVEVYVQANFNAGKLYYELTDVNGNTVINMVDLTISDYGVNRLELYALTEGAFGLCLDDLQIYAGSTAKTFAE